MTLAVENQFSPENSKNKKHRPKSKSWIMGIVVFFIVVFIGSYGWYWFNKPLFYAYYFDLKYNPFKPGDKMYIRDFLVDEASSKNFSRYNLNLYRLVRPLNGDEIDNMNISLADKALIKNDLASKKPYMVECSWAISTDSLCKYKSAFLGNFSGSKIAYQYFGNNKYFPDIFYVIHPIQKALIKVNNDPPPGGYTFDDSFPFYIGSRDVTNHNSKTFRTVK